jgi:hypothetical protein
MKPFSQRPLHRCVATFPAPMLIKDLFFFIAGRKKRINVGRKKGIKKLFTCKAGFLRLEAGLFHVTGQKHKMKFIIAYQTP